MFIAHVFFRVAPALGQTALNALLAECPIVRALPGCTTFLPFIDPTQPGAVGLLHEWESEDQFAAYTASPGFAAVGQVLRPLMVAPPVSKRFDATIKTIVN